jgi:hypothetical protein
MEDNLTTFEIKTLIYTWFKNLTEHAPVEELLALVSLEDDLLIEFPDNPIKNEVQFRNWYKVVTNLFFDEQHVIQMLDISLSGNMAIVKIIVNWQAKTWNAPSPYSNWEGYNVHQDWVVKKDSVTGKALILKYKVGKFDSFKRLSEVQ